MNLSESQIRNIVRQEMATQQNGSRFGITPTSNHAHTGLDSPQINQNNILPGNSVEGSIMFAQAQTTYKIGINFNPTSILVHGNAVGPGGTFMIVGNAQLGPSLYLQPGTSTSVRPGGPPQNIIQSNTYFGLDSGGVAHTLIDEEHIANVNYKVSGVNTFFVRATITGYDSKNVFLYTDTLASGWALNLSFTIT